VKFNGSRCTANVDARLQGRVLLADGQAESTKSMTRLLRLMGLEITTARNGRDAIDIVLRAHEARYGFDLLLMNTQLPIIDACEAAGFLRAEGLTVPIIAVSGSLHHALRDQCLTAGCNNFIRHPIGFISVFQSLRQYLA
jgi:CheY-like chemotaxis protein